MCVENRRLTHADDDVINDGIDDVVVEEEVKQSHQKNLEYNQRQLVAVKHDVSKRALVVCQSHKNRYVISTQLIS